jgi:uncharacterized membrane protein
MWLFYYPWHIFFSNNYMQSKIRIFGHALHSMIVPFPIALYTSTMVCCIVYATNANPFWFHVAFITNCAAIVMAVVAVLPGLIDWFSIPTLSDAKSTGLKHMVANVVALGLFTANAAVMFIEYGQAHPPATSHIMMTVAGFLVMLYAGFKGWSLVQTHHIGIDMNANEEVPTQDEVEKNANEIFTDTKENPQKNK